MREVTFSIIDLYNRTWPLLLDVDRPLQHLLPVLVDSTSMPRNLNYVLVPKGMDQALDGKYSLAQYHLPGGSELYLRPLRDELLRQLLDKLYDEVKDEVKSQLIDAAKEKLRRILNIDPSYPDPFKLKEQLFGPPQFSYYNSNLSGQQPQYQQPQYKMKPKSRSGKGWLIAGVLAGGAALTFVGVVVLAVLVGPALYKAVTGSSQEPELGTGDVQVTLRWDAPVDLDLHVTDPAGEEISFTYRTSTSGGNLDVDANSACGSMVAAPVENVFWPTGGAPSGLYQVSVVYYTNCSYSGPVNYTVTIKLKNQAVNVIDGTVNVSGESQFVTSFNR